MHYAFDSKPAVHAQAIHILNSLPSAERIGKWNIAYEDHESFGTKPVYRYCSVCKEVSVFAYNYCPNCGARMVNDNEE